MSRYKLVPKGGHDPVIFEGIYPSTALNVARFRQYTEAHVFEGDTYLFTLRHGGAWQASAQSKSPWKPNPIWIVKSPRPPVKPSFGRSEGRIKKIGEGTLP